MTGQPAIRRKRRTGRFKAQGATGPRIAHHRSANGARTAQYAANLTCSRVRGGATRHRTAGSGMTLQALHCAAHDLRHGAHRRTRCTMAAKNACQHCGPAHEVRQQPAQRTTVARRQHGNDSGPDHRLGLRLGRRLARSFRHHFRHCFAFRHWVRGNLLLRLSFTFEFGFELAFGFELTLQLEFGFELALAQSRSGELTQGDPGRTHDGGADHRRRHLGHLLQYRGDLFEQPTETERFAFELAFKFAFELALEFAFKLALEFAFEFEFRGADGLALAQQTAEHAADATEQSFALAFGFLQ
jgi:hypothetical protein